MKKLIAFVILLNLSSVLFAKEVTFKVESNGKPIEGAFVCACSLSKDDSNSYNGITDDQGSVALEVPEKSKTLVFATAPGYKYKILKAKKIRDKKVKITLPAGKKVYVYAASNSNSSAMKLFDDSLVFEMYVRTEGRDKWKIQTHGEGVYVGQKKGGKESSVIVKNKKSFYVNKGKNSIKVKLIVVKGKLGDKTPLFPLLEVDGKIIKIDDENNNKRKGLKKAI